MKKKIKIKGKEHEIDPSSVFIDNGEGAQVIEVWPRQAIDIPKEDWDAIKPELEESGNLKGKTLKPVYFFKKAKKAKKVNKKAAKRRIEVVE